MQRTQAFTRMNTVLSNPLRTLTHTLDRAVTLVHERHLLSVAHVARACICGLTNDANVIEAVKTPHCNSLVQNKIMELIVVGVLVSLWKKKLPFVKRAANESSERSDRCGNGLTCDEGAKGRKSVVRFAVVVSCVHTD